MELQIVQIINHRGQGTWIDLASYRVSRMPFMIGLFMVAGIFIFWECPIKRRQLIIALGVAVLLFFLVNEFAFKHLLVDWIGRLRPYMAHPDLITPIGKQFSDSSFPSSHMAITLLMMTLVIREVPMLWPLALGFSVLMAFSRMHNGMHYPSDVLAGSVLGICYAFIGIRAAKKLSQIRIFPLDFKRK